MLASARRTAIAAALILSLAGCGYDYTQNTDRVAYSAGDSVKANLEQETSNPFKRSMYATGGLGKDGNVIPAAAGATAAPASSGSATTASH